jgi:hypothetical protein
MLSGARKMWVVSVTRGGSMRKRGRVGEYIGGRAGSESCRVGCRVAMSSSSTGISDEMRCGTHLGQRFERDDQTMHHEGLSYPR